MGTFFCWSSRRKYWYGYWNIAKIVIFFKVLFVFMFFSPLNALFGRSSKKVSEKWLIIKQRILKFTQNGRFSLINFFFFFYSRNLLFQCFRLFPLQLHSALVFRRIAMRWVCLLCFEARGHFLSQHFCWSERPWHRDGVQAGTGVASARNLPPPPIIKFYSSAVAPRQQRERAAPTRRAESSLHPRWLKPSRCCGHVTQCCRHLQR